MRSIFASCIVGAVSAANTDHWAVIVAGSKHYSSYYNQSDAAMAYEVIQR